MADAQSANGAAASIPQIAPLAKYKLVFLGDQVRSASTVFLEPGEALAVRGLCMELTFFSRGCTALL